MQGTWASSSSWQLPALSKRLFLLGRGGNLLPFDPDKMSSWVGDPVAVGGHGVECFECLLECTLTTGGSNFMLPGHGIATETSLHWKCSWEWVVTNFLFPAPAFCCSSRFQIYTWESSLAHTTYFPSGLNEAEIWLLVFRKPVIQHHICYVANTWICIHIEDIYIYIFEETPLNLWMISEPSMIRIRESAEVTSTSEVLLGANCS